MPRRGWQRHDIGSGYVTSFWYLRVLILEGAGWVVGEEVVLIDQIGNARHEILVRKSLARKGEGGRGGGLCLAVDMISMR